jgi:hypothetical protein
MSFNDDEHVANILAHDIPSHHYNKVNILKPGSPIDIIATTFALIDTGALHGSSAGTWLLTRDLRKGGKFSEKQNIYYHNITMGLIYLNI